jgi:hypothetical protein
MLRVAKLDVHVYREVEADREAMGQATAVVILSSLAVGVGSMVRWGLGGILMGTVATLIGWYVWALLAYLIGTRLLPEPRTRADLGKFLRTIGFSASPGVIRVLEIISSLAAMISLVAAMWMLVAMVIAVREALEYHGTGRAVAVCAIGWIVYMLIGFWLFVLGGAA